MPPKPSSSNPKATSSTSGPKIVIKPRLIAPSSSRTPAASAPQTPATPAAEEEEEEGDDANEQDESEEGDDRDQDDGEGLDTIEDAATDDNDTMDVDQEAEVEAEAEPSPSEPVVPVRRPRGRPRGSGRGRGSSTPRARGRGRGRGRPRGSRGGLTIRLPSKRGEEEEGDGTEPDGGEDPGVAGEGDEGAEGEGEEEGAAEGEGEVKKKKEPIGGGKPFRKIQGEVYVIDGDEFVTPDDPKGDEKIDKWGNLLGGRTFKSATFLLPTRHPSRQYMLAIDAARSSGFRDSLYYFRRNLLAFKLNATQPEKEYLISEGKLGSHLRTRSVTLVTARSAFKLAGAKMIKDGRWVTDDYYESAALASITERGLKPDDPVGELPDPNAGTQAAESSQAAKDSQGSKPGDRSGAGGGIYRAGGPTTIFGASGWGPYSDGPLNAVRKSVLSRDGVSEENWMWMMAQRVADSDKEWKELRKNALSAVQGVLGVEMGLGGGGSLPVREGEGGMDRGKQGGRGEEKGKKRQRERDDEDDEDEDRTDVSRRASPQVQAQVETQKKRKVVFEDGTPPLGVYEPHSDLIHYRATTQPTRARWVPLPDAPSKRRVLGGTKAGNGAWALAWVDTVMEPPTEDDPPMREEIERRDIWKLVEEEGRGREEREGTVDLTGE
ncbi:chromatin remodelling complex Rsc7/Swp82 subunit-domain-containing protein [Crucibulum laeve]|uniref:Chromatin remodelling complex Rsc7/Swp82 subunit-domain-containing protein n=1 Tax=Crucibulum laeve TaxID=68775 RepID=A0A5C3LFE8_9AGAR|nr:chromatin remodelling complex Rsc7/Swp82 subunit-domain-containing protein [Crucibulum laeve]